MLVKIDLPISKELAEKLLYPPLYEFICSKLGWDVLGKVWMASDSYIIYITGDIVKVYNCYNKRFFNYNQGISKPSIIPESINRCSQELQIFRQIDTFQQNDRRSTKEIRSFVNSYLTKMLHKKNNILYGIGGEFYLYFLLNKKYYKQFYGFSNSQSIINIAERNLSNYLKSQDYSLRQVKYDSMDLSIKMDEGISSIIINLSSVPVNIFRLLTLNSFDKIVIITCNQVVFNKRRKMLDSKYKFVDFRHIKSQTAATVVSIYVYYLV